MDDTKNCCHSQYLTDQHEGNSTIYLSLLKKKKEKNFFILGTIVCQDCGLVLHENIPYNTNEITNNDSFAKSSNYFKIVDCCYRMHITYNFIISFIHESFTNERKKPVFQKINDDHLIAYIIYTSLKNLNIPRSLDYVAGNCGVRTNDIWKCEFVDEKLSNPIRFQDIVRSVHSQVGLTMKESDKICDLEENIKNLSFSPLTLAGSLIYFYCKLKKKKVTLKKVAELVNVTNVSICRCLKILKKERRLPQTV